MSSCISAYLVGNAVQVRARPQSGDTVTSGAGWRLVVLPPSGPSVAYPMVAEGGFATGLFTPNAPGRWRYRVETSSPANAAIEGFFDVTARLVPEPP